jgi:hypothetical protein
MCFEQHLQSIDSDMKRRLWRGIERLINHRIELYRRAKNRSKMMSMAGCLPNTKRFRHGRPDRGRC